MRPLTTSQIDRILSLIDAQHSAHQISTITGHHTSTITRLWDKYRPDVPKSRGGRPSKLSSTDVHHALRLINSGIVNNSAQVTRMLHNITNQNLSSKTVRQQLKKVGWKAVVKGQRNLVEDQ